MHSNQSAAGQSKTVRGAFTLVELLMVIAIIGILIGMLAVAIGPVMNTSREFAVTSEMKQIELAIENFKNKYGFYPPSFAGFDRTVASPELQLLPYLNKLSPNHREATTTFPGSTDSRLKVWWDTIGFNFDDRGSLVFWLSGLSNNKQFPITGGLPLLTGDTIDNAAGTTAQLPVAFNADTVLRITNGTPTGEVPLVGTIEREVFFDFRGGQLSDQFFDYDLATPALNTLDPGFRVYNMPYGKASNDLAYRYRNSAFYPAATGRSAAYHINTNGGLVFLNLNTFQLGSLGLDGEASLDTSTASTAINPPATATPAEREEFVKNNDNITNFADGRLDNFDWLEAVDLGGREAE